MTDRKPALTKHRFVGVEGRMDGDKSLFYPATFSEREWVLASDLPPAILNLTKAELAALAVFAEAMPGLLRLHGIHKNSYKINLANTADRALAAAKSTTAEEAEP